MIEGIESDHQLTEKGVNKKGDKTFRRPFNDGGKRNRISRERRLWSSPYKEYKEQ